MTASVKLVYFASVREKIGVPEEVVTPPREIATIADLLDWLSHRGENYAHALEQRQFLRAAIDRKHARGSALIANAREIAVFPPMTGG